MRKTSLTLLSLSMLAFPSFSMAQMAAKPVPQFLPKAGWTVKPAVTGDMRDLKGLKLPCMMMVEYDNGYVMRLSGGNNQLMAMAIDFRQNAFVQGRKYQANIMIDGVNVGKVQATSFSENALIINTRNVPNLYQSLSAGQKMTMNIEGNEFEFQLGNIREAASRLEACYNGDTAISTAGMPQPLGGVSNENMAQPVSLGNQSSQNTITWSDTRDAMARPSGDVSMPAAQPRREKPAQIWRAQQGDSLKTTLTSWAEIAGVAVDWQADMPGTVVEDMALNSNFESAVQSLIAQNSAATGIQADLRGTVNNDMTSARSNVSRAPTPLIPASTAPIASQPRLSEISPIQQPKSASMSNTNWRASQGDNLRLALENWSKRAGVELHWDANQSFAVRRAITSDGTYEDALRSILEQFSNENVRPVAQLNNDPSTGRRVLIIQSSRVL